MLYICIPAYDEAPTVGVLLWRIRKVFEEHPREYEIIVLDDGSTDATKETLEPYAEVLPLTVIRHEERKGYAAAVEALCRAAVQRTRYPRRDAIVLMQADFTDHPEHLPELAKRFEGGADLVVAEQLDLGRKAPTPVRRLRWASKWMGRLMVKVPGITDVVGSFRLVRVSVVKDALKEAGDGPLLRSTGWAANVELLLKLARFSRRTEAVEVPPRYDLRPRPSRVNAWAGALDLYRFGWAARTQRPSTTGP
jgi:glycosyltransferase involved in cell wall biosynthesis